LQAAVRLDSRDAGLAQRLATIANWLNELDAAEGAVAQALRLQASEPSLYFLDGQLAYKRCDLPGAVAALQVSVELTPTNSLYVGSLGGYLLAQGDGGAVDPYLEQLRAAPADDYLSHWLAGALLSESSQAADAGEQAGAGAPVRADDARAEYAVALAAPGLPGSAAAAMHSALGSLAYLEGDLAAAERELGAALAAAPDYVDAEMALGDLALLAGDAAAAEQHYRKAQDSLPAYAANHSYDSATVYDPLLHMRLALAARLAGDSAGEEASRRAAEAALAALRAAAPDWPAVAGAEGLLALIQGDEKRAETAFARAVACDRTLAEVEEQSKKLVAASEP
jgi:predicted Zn-dependent protease